MTRKIFLPKPYQLDIIEHQLDLSRGATFAGMGLGKTAATLSSLDALHMSGEETKPALVVAPLRVAQSTWPDEIAKWEQFSGMEYVTVVGTEAERHHALFNGLQQGNACLYTINYENLPWLMEALTTARKGWPFGLVVADESTKLKNFRLRQGTQRAKALGRIAHTKATRWINLTGTPAPNGLKDLWGQTWFLDQGVRLGRTHEAFKDRWFRTSRDGHGMEPMPFAKEQIELALKDICVTITKGLDVEEPIVNEIRIELPAKARALYRDMERRMFMEVEGLQVEAFGAAAKSNKCRQLASGAAYVDADPDPEDRVGRAWREIHTAKLQALESIIEEANGMPVLVAYDFRSDLARIMKAFPKARYLDANPQTLRDWNAGLIPVLVAHPASAGHGLNLQDGGNIIAFFSVNWNLEEHDQIIERIGPNRQKQSGHDRPVFVHYIIAADTVDEHVLERLKTKREVQDILMEALKRKGRAT